MSMDIFRRWPLEQPDIPHEWKRPISADKVTDKQHYIPAIKETDQLVPSICGKLFNPGFARIDKRAPKCFNCERRLK